ncbi:polygalacturonase QRT2-like [Andrographis paniculata]|uniref:polygalacturonase QRT2-like n=1 Tax=Andrographis paniculata TaxID=175694 RepID=UPI0021E728B8|nr:polygalacturonase QRT2-like [Andrographis paniculata]
MILIALLSCSSCLARKCNCSCKPSKKSHHHHHRHRHHHHHQPRRNNSRLIEGSSHGRLGQYLDVLNIEDFGAKADGKTNNFQAFKTTWDKACKSSRSTKILVPRDKTYYVKHANFTGPCRSDISMEIQGTIKAFPQMYDVPRRLWIMFEDVRNINVFGGGTLDGNGEIWWKNSCKIKKTKPCQSQNAPTALTFKNCANLRVNNLRLLNAQQMHVNFQDCNQVEASGLTVVSPKESPNTDGIHVTRTTNINILNALIQTGDDCVSIVNGSRNVGVRNIVCGPGHGISIGSLGEDNTENYVSAVFVKGVKLIGTTNGARIKTWQGGRGSAKNIVFEDIEMRDVHNPIIINQYYCDKKKNCQREKSGVQVEKIVYKNIRGTSASKVAINFNCSQTVPCKNLRLENVNLTPQTQGEKIEALCSSAIVSKKNSIPSCN